MFTLDPLSILRPPYKYNFRPDEELRGKIAGYFKEALRDYKTNFRTALPAVMPSWGKVRIAYGGDSIRTKSASRNPNKERNMSFVRVSIRTRCDCLCCVLFLLINI